MKIKKITTERLYLIPFTIPIAQEVLNQQYTILSDMGLNLSQGWPDEDTNLEMVEEPSGFESWLIVEKESKAIIGDIGFKGKPDPEGSVDLGYGIVDAARRKGYAVEAGAALIKWTFKQQQVKVITARCMHVNEGSTKTLERLGFYQKVIKEEMVHWFLLREPGSKKELK
jgi:ribosomal-protein-alanine N-acetyltransferase